MRRIILVLITILIISKLTGVEMKGQIVTAETEGIKIHSYIGYSGDVSNIIETVDALILLDEQPTLSAGKELREYINGLNKPLTDVIIPSHGIGINDFGVEVLGTKPMLQFIESGAASGFIEAFTQRFGEDMNTNLLTLKPTLVEGENKIGNLKVRVKTHVKDYPPCSDLYFLDGKVVFTHLAANHTHLLMSNPEEVNELTKFWESIQDAEYVMSSHFGVIGKDGIVYTLEYVKKAAEVYNSAESKEMFMQKMGEAYPDAGLDFFLGMTADNFYK